MVVCDYVRILCVLSNLLRPRNPWIKLFSRIKMIVSFTHVGFFGELILVIATVQAHITDSTSHVRRWFDRVVKQRLIDIADATSGELR